MPFTISWLPSLEEVNLVDNPIEAFKECVMALKTLPNLRSLHIDLSEEQEVDFVIRNLVQITSLNGEHVDRTELIPQSREGSEADPEQADVVSATEEVTSQSTQLDEVTLRPEDLERIAILFDKIRTTQRKKIHTTSDKEMAYEFDEHLKSCM